MVSLKNIFRKKTSGGKQNTPKQTNDKKNKSKVEDVQLTPANLDAKTTDAPTANTVVSANQTNDYTSPNHTVNRKNTAESIDQHQSEQYDEENHSEDEQNEDELYQDDSEEEDFLGVPTFDDAKDENDFSCLSPEEIISEQQRQVQSVAELLSITLTSAAALLRHFQWRKERLIDAYLKNPEHVRKDAGLAPTEKAENEFVSSAVQLKGEEMCSICAEDVPANECTALSCLHRFCNDCWNHYLSMKINEGEVVKIKCPQMKCHLIVNERTVKNLVSSDAYEKYLRFITKAFVEDSDGRVKWCPRPGCGNAITADMISGTVVRCSCGYQFCFSCHKEAHLPATCEQVKTWDKKCKDDSETTHWKYANTKDCPKCETSVEKNGGCNHMVCRQCKHEWCWVCLRAWKGHNDFYNCNKFMEPEKKRSLSFFSKDKKKDKLKEKEMERERNRVALERYLHYYERYQNHAHSGELEKQMKSRALAKMNEMQKEATTTSEVQYIVEGNEELLNCRNVLKYTYVYSYFLPESGSVKELFQYLQEDLEKTTEQLSETLENTATDSSHRLKAVNMIQLANTRRNNLLNAVAEQLNNM